MKKASLLLLMIAVVGMALSTYAAAPEKAPRKEKPITYTAKLLGTEEVPPVTTKTTGEAVLILNRAMDTLIYRVHVRNLEKPTGAHLHLGAKGTNGEPVLMLYPEKEATPPTTPGPKPGHIMGKIAKPVLEHRPTGLLAKGTLKAEDLTGPLAGKTLKDLDEKIKAGEVYVNVHTEKNTEGEIRGQLGTR